MNNIISLPLGNNRRQNSYNEAYYDYDYENKDGPADIYPPEPPLPLKYLDVE